MAALVDTIVANSPAIFIRKVEGSVGQRDVVILSPQSTDLTGNNRLAVRTPPFLNFTQIDKLLSNGIPGTTWWPGLAPQFAPSLQIGNHFGGDDAFSYYSPRHVLRGAFVFSDCAPESLTNNTVLHNNSLITNVTCKKGEKAIVQLIDTNRERRMGFGRDWPFPRLKNDSIILSRTIASHLKAQVGDKVVLAVYLTNQLVSYAAQYGTDWEIRLAKSYSQLRVSLTVAGIAKQDSYGKVVSSASSTSVFMELDLFTEVVRSGMEPALRENTGMHNWLGRFGFKEIATEVTVNFPPERLKPYLRTNFDDVLADAVTFATVLRVCQ